MTESAENPAAGEAANQSETTQTRLTRPADSSVAAGACTERRTKMYTRLWRSKFLTTRARSIGDLIEALGRAADELRRMQQAGVTLNLESGVADGYAELVTDDLSAAREFGFAVE